MPRMNKVAKKAAKKTRYVVDEPKPKRKAKTTAPAKRGPGRPRKATTAGGSLSNKFVAGKVAKAKAAASPGRSRRPVLMTTKDGLAALPPGTYTGVRIAEVNDLGNGQMSFGLDLSGATRVNVDSLSEVGRVIDDMRETMDAVDAGVGALCDKLPAASSIASTNPAGTTQTATVTRDDNTFTFTGPDACAQAATFGRDYDAAERERRRVLGGAQVYTYNVASDVSDQDTLAKRIKGVIGEVEAMSSELDKSNGSWSLAAPCGDPQAAEQPKRRASDAVVHPHHYNAHPSGIEAIEVLEGFNFNLGSAMKYIWRAGLKNGTKIQDLRKAREYIDFEIARIEKYELTPNETA